VTSPDVCPLCEGNGWVLVERRAGLVLAARCECLSPRGARTPQVLPDRVPPDFISQKSRAAGDVE